MRGDLDRDAALEFAQIVPARAAVLAYVRAHPEALRRDVEHACRIPSGTARSTLSALVREGVLRVRYEPLSAHVKRARWSDARSDA